MKFSTVLKRHPNFAMRYGKDNKRLFVYYKNELNPIVVAFNRKGSWTVNDKPIDRIETALEIAQDIVSRRVTRDNGHDPTV